MTERIPPNEAAVIDWAYDGRPDYVAGTGATDEERMLVWGAAAIAGSTALAGLLELDLADAELTDAGARALLGSPYLDGLLRLNLASTSRERQAIGPAARWALTERFGSRVSF